MYPLQIIIKLFLLTDSPQKLNLEQIHGKRFMKIILFYVNPSSPQLKRLIFVIKNRKTTTLQQVTGGNTPNIP